MSEAYDACNPEFTPMTARDYLELRIERAVHHNVQDAQQRRDIAAYEHLFGTPALNSFLLAARTRAGLV